MTAQSVFAWADDALGRSEAVELSARMLKGEVSSGELVEAAIARAERVNVPVVAVINSPARKRVVHSKKRPVLPCERRPAL